MTGDDVVRTTSSPVALSASRPRPERLARGVLAVHAHPDDETLSTGALLATCAAWGVPALVVTCTRGERGEVLALPGTTSEGLAHLEGDGPALAAHRERELAAALTALGGGDPVALTHRYLDTVAPATPASPAELSGGGGSLAPRAPDTSERFEDSGMVWVAPGVAGPDPAVPAGFAVVPLDDAAGRLARLIREVRPSAVATYEAGGGYGHPDHVRSHQVAARAVELAADPAFVVAAVADDAAVRDDAAGRDGAAVPDDAAVPGDTAGRDALVPWAAELWVRVAAADELRRERAALVAHSEARALATAAGLTFPAAEETLPPVARDDAAIAAQAATGRVVEVDVAPVLGAVVAAMRAHATQVQHALALDPSRDRSPGPRLLGWYALSNGVLAPIGRTELYQVAVAADAPPTSVGSAG